jgi:hypothetical protein
VHLDNLAEKWRPQVESARLPEEKTASWLERQPKQTMKNFVLGIERWKRNLPLETQVMTYSGHTALMWSRTTSATTR